MSPKHRRVLFLFLAVILTLSGLGIWAGSPRPTTPVGSWVDHMGAEMVTVSAEMQVTFREGGTYTLREVAYQAYEETDGWWFAVDPNTKADHPEWHLRQVKHLPGAKVYQFEELGPLANIVVKGNRMSIDFADGGSDLRRKTWFNSFEWWWYFESPWRSYRP